MKRVTVATTRTPQTDISRLDQELLLGHVLGLSRAELYAHPERLLTSDQLNAYRRLVERRARGEPLPYLVGHVEFYGLDFLVDPRVLIPRPETETLVDLALAFIQVRPRPTVADVGTGSGCIAVALAVRRPQVSLYALDISEEALDVARANAERHKVADRITFLASDLLMSLPEPADLFDLIVANPPYVAAQEWPDLLPEVGEYEPRQALDGGPDGLGVVRRLLDQATTRLAPGGALLVEIGATQGAAAVNLARQVFPEASVTLHSDLAGRDRVLELCTPLQGREFYAGEHNAQT